MLNDITPIILTYNEEPNIARTLDALSWAKDILVVDSFSTDATLELARARPGVRVVQRRFDCFANQWNYALAEGGLRTEWALALDADYVLTPELVTEMGALAPEADVFGYEARFRYCIDGVPLRGSLYPPNVVLFRRRSGHFEQDGHAYRLQRAGRIEPLAHFILHDDRKPFARWLQSQARYAAEEARKLRATRWEELKLADRVRRIPLLATPVVMAYCLGLKGCALDGRAGLIYTAQRMLAELAISIELLHGASNSEARD